MDIPSITGLTTYPATWDEASKDLAMYADITAGYYARACAATDPSDKGMFSDIIGGRLAEIRRRGWFERVEKYLDVSGSTFDLRRMEAWAQRESRAFRQWQEGRVAAGAK
jgi:hypothetical protein